MKELDVTIRVRNNRLLERRQKLGVTQREMAQAIGIPIGVYGDFEGLRASPIVDGEWTKNAMVLAEYYDVDPGELFPDAVVAVKQSVFNKKIDGEEILSLSDPAVSLMLPPPDENREGLKEAVDVVLETLTPRESRVLRLRFGIDGDEKTLQEVSGVIGSNPAFRTSKAVVTLDRVRQVEAKALRKLRHPSKSKYLKVFVEKKED